jgi:hypothetical protein
MKGSDMPNWCDNDITFVGDKEVLDKVLDFIKPNPNDEGCKETSLLSLNSIYPLPADMKEDGRWYNWCINNWGTKWDVDAYSKDDYEYEGKRYVIMHFASAWGPPQAAIEHLSKAFPEIFIHHSYDESGMDFSGYDVYYGGDAVERIEYGFSVCNATSSMDSMNYFEWNDFDYLKKKAENEG